MFDIIKNIILLMLVLVLLLASGLCVYYGFADPKEYGRLFAIAPFPLLCAFLVCQAGKGIKDKED